ncbi:hypothetical protein C8F04DRAFT_1178220 [Mycena alexandri]|uniref:Uncharacterized protein n=1 Tax=Mycena alexandri TaxID=1745969 RepID=A0AAD6T823_9AGAR|nr:hypothetical protein C8F04DRAFT_1178220 [Mycena alexandri]
MPASRTKKRSATAQTNASVPVPRITDPYAPRDEDDVYPETSAEKAATEEVRADFNRKIVLLQKKHETLVAATSTSNATGADEGAERDAAIFDSYWDHQSALQAYEDIYGKFLPDADVSEWMARKKIRETELLKLREAAGGIEEHDHQDMVLYLAREGAFEDDFGHEFSSNDGLDGHFKRMALHASSAQELALCHDNDKPRMLAAAALPVTFDIYNPYKEGHPDREAFDETFRGYMPAYWKNDPPAGNGNPNVIRLSFRNPGVDTESILRGYYDMKFIEEDLQTAALYHWEVAADRDVGVESIFGNDVDRSACVSACVAFTLSDGSHRLMVFVVALVFPLRTTNKTSVPICGHNERPVDDTTFNLPTPTMPFPYKNLIDYCTTQQRNALRYDMNLVDDDDPNHKFFPTWSEMQAEKKWHPADTPCSMCGLFVALFGFGCYFKNTIEPELGSHIIWHICKACFRFSDSNPRFDWETMTTTAPPCSCPPGFLACGDAYTDCALHANVPAITPAPAGRVEGRGPLLRSEARETMYQLLFDLHDACDKAKWGTEAKRLADERLAAFNIHYDNFQSDPKWVFPETLAPLFVKPPAKSALNVPSPAKGQTSNAKVKLPAKSASNVPSTAKGQTSNAKAVKSACTQKPKVATRKSNTEDSATPTYTGPVRHFISQVDRRFSRLSKAQREFQPGSDIRHPQVVLLRLATEVLDLRRSTPNVRLTRTRKRKGEKGSPTRVELWPKKLALCFSVSATRSKCPADCNGIAGPSGPVAASKKTKLPSPDTQ